MMRKAAILLSVIFLASCEINSGPTGPQGPQGPPGPAGPVGQGFEVEANFNQSNGYQQIFTFPNNVEVLSTDIVMVYLLWEVDQQTGYDVWQPLPVSVFFNDGEMQYAFDHTLADLKLFLTGDTDISTVGPEFTQGQIFRIAVLPVDYVQSKNINLQDVEEVMQAIDVSNIKRLEIGDH
ncbi:MAG: hypothetical protein U5J95_11805 [Balneolaceae bacterium]|nr:hypothetical protein [Balneolaceae bacterium]